MLWYGALKKMRLYSQKYSNELTNNDENYDTTQTDINF